MWVKNTDDTGLFRRLNEGICVKVLDQNLVHDKISRMYVK